MKRSISAAAAAAVLAMAAAGCGSSHNYTGQYPSGFKTGLVQACSAQNAKSKCECLADTIEKNVPFKTVAAAANGIESGSSKPSWYTKAEKACL